MKCNTGLKWANNWVAKSTKKIYMKQKLVENCIPKKQNKKKQKKNKKVVENICTISRDEIGCSVNNICLHLLLRKHKINDLSCVPKM